MRVDPQLEDEDAAVASATGVGGGDTSIVASTTGDDGEGEGDDGKDDGDDDYDDEEEDLEDDVTDGVG